MKKAEKIKVWKKLKNPSLKSILERANLNWRKLKIEHESGVILDFRYPLTPKFFLNSARDDFKDKSARGLVNALTNAKRAIDCQTDSFLSAIGYTPKGLEKQLGKTVIEGLLKFAENPGQPLKFLVLESLGIVTPGIVNRVRDVRHLLEHQYKKPSAKAVKDAIDVAALYLSACNGAMHTFLQDVHIGCDKYKHPLHGEFVFDAAIWISLENYNDPVHINIHFFNSGDSERADINVSPSDPCYLALLRVLFAVRSEENVEQAIAFLAKCAGFEIPNGKVKVESIDYC
jgi:hypothetical protein